MSDITSNAILAEKIWKKVQERYPDVSNLVWNDIHDLLEESRPTSAARDFAIACEKCGTRHMMITCPKCGKHVPQSP